MSDYRSRLKSALQLFAEAATKGSPTGGVQSRSPAPDGTQGASSAVTSTTYTLLLARNRLAHLTLPLDVDADDVRRLSGFLAALPLRAPDT